MPVLHENPEVDAVLNAARSLTDIYEKHFRPNDPTVDTPSASKSTVSTAKSMATKFLAYDLSDDDLVGEITTLLQGVHGKTLAMELYTALEATEYFLNKDVFSELAKNGTPQQSKLIEAINTNHELVMDGAARTVKALAALWELGPEVLKQVESGKDFLKLRAVAYGVTNYLDNCPSVLSQLISRGAVTGEQVAQSIAIAGYVLKQDKFATLRDGTPAQQTLFTTVTSTERQITSTSNVAPLSMT